MRKLIVLLLPLGMAASCVSHPTDDTDAELGGAGGSTETGGVGGAQTGGDTSAGGTGLGGGGASGGSGGAGWCDPESIPADAFVTVWNTDPDTWDITSGPNVVALPVDTQGSHFTVNWCDGTTDSERSHEYAQPGTYMVVIRGAIEGWHFGEACVVYQDGSCYYEASDAEKLVEIRQWGSFRFGTTAGAFEGCRGLHVTATDVPDLSAPTTLQRAFAGCNALTEIPSIATWDTSQITDLSGMFRETSFNGDLSNWDTSSVTNMANLFLFSDFNGDISAWDTSSVTDMAGMFDSSSFRGDVSMWDTANVTSMAYMFASGFDGDISDWDTSSVTNMNGMFRGGFFSGDISGWDTSSVTNMKDMFSFAYISGATSRFAGDLSAWDTSSVTNMSGMFDSAILFDDDLSGWNVGSLTDASEMFDGSGLSTENYDALLMGWAAQSTQTGVTFGAEGVQYSAAAASSRAVLENDHNWTIADGGPDFGFGGAGGAPP